MESLSTKEEKTRFYLLLALTVSILLLGTGFYHYVEGFSIIDSFYFSVVTLTTVGYGDLYPTTEIGKLFTAGYVISGIGILIAFADVFVKQVMRQRQRFIHHTPNKPEE